MGFSSFKLIIIIFFFAIPGGIQDLSSLTRDQTHAPCSGRVDS